MRIDETGRIRLRPQVAILTAAIPARSAKETLPINTRNVKQQPFSEAVSRSSSGTIKPRLKPWSLADENCVRKGRKPASQTRPLVDKECWRQVTLRV